MTQYSDTEQAMMQFLLGTLPEAEQDALERSFPREEFFDLLAVAEDNLIDSYLSGSLSAEMTRLFEKDLAFNPRILERVELTRALNRYLSKPLAFEGSTARRPRPLPESRLETLFAFLRPRSVALLGFSLATVVLLSTVSILWILKAERQIRELQQGSVALDARERQLREQLAAQSATLEQTTKELGEERAERDRLEKSLAEIQQPRPLVASLTLQSDESTRSANGSRSQSRLILKLGTQLIRLALVVDMPGRFSTYRAVVRTDQRDILIRNNLHAIPYDGTEAICFTLSSDLLQTGSYLIVLSGRTANGDLADIGSYVVEVAKR